MATIKSISQLRSAGGIVSRDPVKKEITWEHVTDEGEELSHTFDVWIVRPCLQTGLAIYKDIEAKTKEGMAVVISSRLMMPNDKDKLELMSYDDAMQLHESLALTLFNAVQEVGRPPKNLRPPTSSSASSSPAESEATP